MNLPRSFQETCHRLDIHPTPHCLFVNVSKQSLTHYFEGESIQMPISTAVNSTGQQMNSNQTPLGLHRIEQKIGAGAAAGTVFEARLPARFDGNGDPTALITDRILWLGGLEPGHNQGGRVDSFNRYIYIHGVGNESRLGQPNSAGCIHAGTADLLPLFDAVSVGTLVYISEN